MNKQLLILFFLLHVINVFAQKFDVDTLLYNDEPVNSFNLVIMGDGYTEAELSKFKTDAQSFTDYFFSGIPYKHYKSYFNVFIINVISAESGVKHPRTASDCPSATEHPQSNPNNYFGSSFDSYGIHRLVVLGSPTKIGTVLFNNFPYYDLVVVLANSPFYGGSGGNYALATTHSNSNEIALHEIGHTLADLADEYWAGSQYAKEKANMTQDNNTTSVRWKHWLNTGTGISIYQHSGQPWYKPTSSNCKMEVLNKSFCAVCNEAIIEEVHSIISPVKAYFPDTSVQAIDQSILFSLQIKKPEPNTLKTEWKINNEVIALNLDTFLLQKEMLNAGNNIVSVSVIDTTSMIRIASHFSGHIYITSWEISKSMDIKSNEPYTFSFSIYPNPVSEEMIVEVKSGKEQKAQLIIFDIDGKKIRSENIFLGVGNLQSKYINLTGLKAGVYQILFRSADFSHSERFVKM